jgi:hypothetical protein
VGVVIPVMEREYDLREEQRRIRKLRLVVDVTAQVLAEDEKLTLCEALRLVEAARQAALRLFPEKGDTFDLVSRPRLENIILERFGVTSVAPVN